MPTTPEPTPKQPRPPVPSGPPEPGPRRDPSREELPDPPRYTLSRLLGVIALLFALCSVMGFATKCDEEDGPTTVIVTTTPAPGETPTGKIKCVVEYGKTYCNRTD